MATIANFAFTDFFIRYHENTSPQPFCNLLFTSAGRTFRLSPLTWHIVPHSFKRRNWRRLFMAGFALEAGYDMPCPFHVYIPGQRRQRNRGYRRRHNQNCISQVESVQRACVFACGVAGTSPELPTAVLARAGGAQDHGLATDRTGGCVAAWMCSTMFDARDSESLGVSAVLYKGALECGDLPVEKVVGLVD